MNEHKELELKYLTNKDFKLARLLNLLTKNGFIILDMHDVINIDKYFDTPNKDLLKDGASLRIRIVNNKPYGTLKYPVNKDNNYCERIEIENIFVLENYRCNGVGSKLMEYLINTCYDKKLINITLEVRKSNSIAISLYKKYGFNKVGVRHNYYGNEDGLLMEKKVL